MDRTGADMGGLGYLAGMSQSSGAAMLETSAVAEPALPVVAVAPAGACAGGPDA